ncbi:hypothetical protein QTI66_35830 [Variovorax sp. J22R133]|uniref:hypothetical protein n=1 Tax=Variovorax brevis TaxID=3053503 RepID=UPI0025770F54|nr:hypothetical protein [Variovorax sp. J22R133]MDM0117489.1 hypothetical protein [Variovorax sp. J22R133]
MKPSLLSAFVPVCIFAAAMIHGAGADGTTVDPTPCATKRVLADVKAELVRFTGAGSRPDTHVLRPK